MKNVATNMFLEMLGGACLASSMPVPQTNKKQQNNMKLVGDNFLYAKLSICLIKMRLILPPQARNRTLHDNYFHKCYKYLN